MLADDRSRWALKGSGDRSCASDKSKRAIAHSRLTIAPSVHVDAAFSVSPRAIVVAPLGSISLHSQRQSSGQIQKYPGVNRGIFFQKRNGLRLESELCYNHTTQVIR